MNKRALLLFAMSAMLGRGQQDMAMPPSHVPDTTKLYRLNYAQASHIVDVIGGLGFNMRGDNAMRAVVVRATPERQAEALRLISELDQPASGSSRDVEVTVYVIAASEKTLPQSSTPGAMEPVIKQLKSVFPYAGYEVLDTMLVRSREGEEASTDGTLRHVADSADQHPQMYTLRYEARADPGGKPRTAIHLDKFQFNGFLGEGRRTSLSTNVDLQEGQKVVVGKSNIEDGSAALFVVVSARMLGSEGETGGR